MSRACKVSRRARTVMVAVVGFLLGEDPATFDNALARFYGDLAPFYGDPTKLDGNLAWLGLGLVSLDYSAKFGIDLAPFYDDLARLDDASSNSGDDPSRLDDGSAEFDKHPARLETRYHSSSQFA